MKKLYFTFLSLVFLCFNTTLFSQLTPIVDSIPMRDGKKLAADIYIPSGMTSGPVILVQTPYNRQYYRYIGLPLQIGNNVNSSNYIFVFIDWRGFYGSAAASYSNSPSQGQDGHDCVEWIAQQSWSNGKIGTWGPSALGRVQFQTAEENPPHLVCICPLVAAPQFNYTEYFPNGVLRTEYVQQLSALGYGITPFLMLYPVRNNIWSYVENTNYYPDSIRVPCLMIGGWYDHNTETMVDFFNAIKTQSPVSVRSQHKLLMGPWVHGGTGIAQVGTATQGQLSYPNAANKNDTLARQFFDYYLRNVANSYTANPNVQYYQMGDNTWNSNSTWPVNGASNTLFYFHQSGLMDNNIPSNTTDLKSYNYDPNDPSPTVGGPTLKNGLTQGPYDQATSVENRNDILSFTTDALTQDAVMKGNAVVHLKIASNRYDTDFMIRLTDVYPDGRSMLVNDGAMRMRFRNGLNTTDTVKMIPGQIYDCIMTLPNTAITFLAGHKIRVDVSSSNYPRFNRNMNTDGPMYPGNNVDVLVNPVVATNTVYVNSSNPSYISLPLYGYTAGINELQETSVVQIFPNPASDVLSIQKIPAGKHTLNIYNLNGEKVYTSEVEYSTEIDVKKWNSAIYFIELQNQKTKQIETFKWIKN